MPGGDCDKYCSRFLEEYFRNNKDFHHRKEKRIKIKTTKSLLPKAWQRTFVQKAPLVGFEKKRKDVGGYFDGCREELMGITIPLKYLPCDKK